MTVVADRAMRHFATVKVISTPKYSNETARYIPVVTMPDIIDVGDL